MKVTPETKLKRPLELICKGEVVKLFRHEKGSSYCVVEFPNGQSKTAALCDLELVGKVRKPIGKTKKKLTPEEKKEQAELNEFYESLWNWPPHFHCANCHKELRAIDPKKERAVSAHILPKSIYKEVATHRDNILFLGVITFGSACNCHPTWDSCIEKRMKMRIYPYALKKYLESLRPLLTTKHKQDADEYMGLVTKHTNLAKDLTVQIQ